MAKARILVVEDDSSLLEVLAFNLEGAGYEVLTARDGAEGLGHARLRSPELIVLDLMIPEIDGLDVCRALRNDPNTRDILILMLSARSEETDQLIGFTLGADDYVTKPFSIKVLLERIKSLLRRRVDGVDDRSLATSQGVTIDRQRHQATADEQPLDLTPTEFSLLDTLLRQPGRAFSRGELIDTALGSDVVVLERTIDVHIRALRQKLGRHAHVIETVRGVGYRFRDPRG